MNHDAFAVYFVLFGMAAIFLFSGANVMPTSTNNRKAIEKRFAAAEEAVTGYVDSLHLGLPVPACYLHPVTVERMQRAVREGRAESVEDAFDVVKNDRKRPTRMYPSPRRNSMRSWRSSRSFWSEITCR